MEEKGYIAARGPPHKCSSKARLKSVCFFSMILALKCARDESRNVIARKSFIVSDWLGGCGGLLIAICSTMQTRLSGLQGSETGVCVCFHRPLPSWGLTRAARLNAHTTGWAVRISFTFMPSFSITSQCSFIVMSELNRFGIFWYFSKPWKQIWTRRCIALLFCRESHGFTQKKIKKGALLNTVEWMWCLGVLLVYCICGIHDLRRLLRHWTPFLLKKRGMFFFLKHGTNINQHI